jgi:hypothetical protein
MKWNWGTKIFIAILLFMALIIGFVIASFQHTVNLVEKDYYPKGQIYQTRLDEIKNAVPYRDSFIIEKDESNIILTLPEINADTASITFFRPSGTKFDRIYDISSGNTVYKFANSKFIRGKYKIKIYWKSKGTANYFERDFFFE